ncbi:MAG: hypothetical protein PHD82_06315 [Candidatus Riflebacteria bacterium]|nr:hypothetical protein [Candidatus Riflebacteria bacterium]
MTRLSMLLGLFMAVTITGIVMLMAVMGNVASSTIIYRGLLVFFLFGILGTMLGSFLEIVLMPITTEKETEKLKDEILLEDAELKAELGDLLDEDKSSNNQTETFGTPTDESWPGTASNGGSSAVVS